MYHQVKIRKLGVLPTQGIICFVWMSKKHKLYSYKIFLVAWYNRQGERLLFGTKWIVIYSSVSCMQFIGLGLI